MPPRKITAVPVNPGLARFVVEHVVQGELQLFKAHGRLLQVCELDTGLCGLQWQERVWRHNAFQ